LCCGLSFPSTARLRPRLTAYLPGEAAPTRGSAAKSAALAPGEERGGDLTRALSARQRKELARLQRRLAVQGARDRGPRWHQASPRSKPSGERMEAASRHRDCFRSGDWPVCQLRHHDPGGRRHAAAQPDRGGTAPTAFPWVWIGVRRCRGAFPRRAGSGVRMAVKNRSDGVGSALRALATQRNLRPAGAKRAST